MRTVDVALGERSYPIVIGRGLLGGAYDLSRHLPGPDWLIVSDLKVAPLWLDALRQCLGGRSGNTVILEEGEARKTLSSVQLVIDGLVAAGANRDSTVLALGGGVVGDIAGFAAACYMRGVRYIQVPTTLLAQVDSSVGGKTGVNHEGGKNLIGAFHQPSLVLVDTDTLSTLPDREFRAGLAEVIKHAVIADAAFFSWLETNLPALLARDPPALAHAVQRSCEIKAALVAADEREQGRRALLNFGHSFGHAIENCLGYGEWLHGEAVAAGMLMAAGLGELPADSRERLRRLISAAGLPIAPPRVGAARLRQAMQLDKKVQGKALRLVLVHALGSAEVGSGYSAKRLEAVLRAADG